VLDRRKLDEIMDVLETNARISTGSSITLPSSSNTSLLAFVSNTSMISSSLRHEEGRTTTVIGNALPDSEVKCITPADIVASMSYFFNLLNILMSCCGVIESVSCIDILSRTTRSILDKPIRN
jgi:DNA-directed RNA polymerase subunit beta